jgi:anti-sigma factor RsiW
MIGGTMMTESKPRPERRARSDERSARRWWATAPRWVRVFAVVGIVVVALIVVMLVSGHGPGRHMQDGLGLYRLRRW